LRPSRAPRSTPPPRSARPAARCCAASPIFGQSIGDYFEAGRQNGELRDQLREAEAKLTQAQAATLDNQRLRQLVELREAATDEVATGRIVSSSWDGPRRYAVLSVGSDQGVAYNMRCARPKA
jgi:rod shape-determining protein MreC